VRVLINVSSYSKVDAVEQRGVVNSGVRGAKDWNLRTEVDWYSALIRVSCLLVYLPCHVKAPTGIIQ
jgi:hypothetical protein